MVFKNRHTPRVFSPSSSYTKEKKNFNGHYVVSSSSNTTFNSKKRNRFVVFTLPAFASSFNTSRMPCHGNILIFSIFSTSHTNGLTSKAKPSFSKATPTRLYTYSCMRYKDKRISQLLFHYTSKNQIVFNNYGKNTANSNRNFHAKYFV